MEIIDAIKKINEKQLFVPAFQREYVWKRDDAKNLIRSLIYKYPTGTMLTWETNTPPELKGSYVHEESRGSVKLVLDGQQRITTLYMLITGKIPPYYTEQEIKNNIRGMYVNIETLELEYYKKSIMEKNPSWVDISDVFKGDINPRDITDEIAKREEMDRLPKERESAVYDNIRAIEKIKERNFLEQEIPSSASLKEAIDIFYIVNASGVNLTDAELALAQISGYWPKARDLFKAKLQDLEQRGWVFKLDFIVYLLLAIIHRQGSKMSKLHLESDNAEIQNVWKKLESHVLDYACNILQSHAYVDHTNEINSVYALVPFITYIYNCPGQKLNEKEIEAAVKWFYYSQVRSRYVSQMPQKLDKDLRAITESESPFEELIDGIAEERPLEIKASEFIGRDIRHPLFSLMRWYFKSQGAICLGTGLQLHRNMGKPYALERDHIFAYSLLRDSDEYDMDNRYDYAAAQEISNRAILTAVENRTKSAKKADIYLAKVVERFPNALKLQCIPEDPNLWKTEKYKEFLKARRDLLANALNEFLNNLPIAHRDYTARVDIKDLIEGGECSQVELKSTLRWNLNDAQQDKAMEAAILKTIAGFSNKDGGTLLIGVADSGEVLGLDNDYNSLKSGNKDGFEIHLRNLTNHAYGKDFTTSQLTISFPAVDDLEICEIQIKRGLQEVYTEVANKDGAKRKAFYCRSGNSTPEMNIKEAATYIKERFSNS
jgi:hypothetical protein